MSEDDLALPAVESMLHQRHAMVRQVYGWTAEDALMETQLLCTHLAAAANHELSGRKIRARLGGSVSDLAARWARA